MDAVVDGNMCACVYACIHVCMCVCVCMCVHIDINMHIRACADPVNMQIDMCSYLSSGTHVRVRD